MKVAILSGKGGAGKTLLAVNLASCFDSATYVDCDVEEPNGHLFFKPENVQEELVNVSYPKFNKELCTGCRKCTDFCRFNALAYVKEKVIVFEEVCHSCKGCLQVCPTNALSLREKAIGKIQKGIHNNIKVNTGMLNMGEASGVPVINKLLKESVGDNIIIDCPPGSACVVMESIKDADYCVLVAEPTIFGVHNLNMVYELTQVFNKNVGVVINKCVEGDNLALDYCNKNHINVLGKIMFDKELGNMSSKGEIAVEKDPKYKLIFNDILQNIVSEVGK